MTQKILLGYELQTGLPVHILLHHLAIFGMTQKSGKTTALEALISRANLKAIAFITKRGEAGFTKYNTITPYYKPRADWQYLESLLNTALREKVQYQPFMRWAILQVTKKHPGTLRTVLERSKECEKQYPRRKEVFEQLSAYLELVVPELERWRFSEKLELAEGVNVMDLSDMRLETQHIVIASTIEYALANLDHIVVMIPEAWETLPQTHMTPVKWVAEQFIRKGAALGNYLWLDSQDIGGIDKTPLRQCDNWIMGRMKEAHEVERILKQLLGAEISAEDIQTLGLGTFYAVIGNEVKKVYALPNGVPEEVGVAVALGRRTPESVRDEFLNRKVEENEEAMFKERCEELERKIEDLEKDLENDKKTIETQSQKISQLSEDLKGIEALKKLREALIELYPIPNIAMPEVATSKQTLNLENSELTVNLSLTEKTVQLDTTKQQGQIMYVALKDLAKDGFTESELSEALKNRGWPISHASLATHLAVNLPKLGWLIKLEGKPMKYRLPSKLKVQES